MNIREFIVDRCEVVIRKCLDLYSRKKLSDNAILWHNLQDYLSKTTSTGCGYIDYYALYKEIKFRKSREVLECGTGVSTLIIAHALMENERDGEVVGRVTSMEESREWLEMSRSLLPEEYAKYVDFYLSDTIEDSYSFFRGVRYSNIPERAYDFVFVDGPKYFSPIDGTPTFDFDFLYVLRNSTTPVSGIIDKRVSTCFVLQQIIGVEKVTYSPVKGLGFISPCTRHDLGCLSEALSSENFSKSFKLFGRTVLQLTPIKKI